MVGGNTFCTNANFILTGAEFPRWKRLICEEFRSWQPAQALAPNEPRRLEVCEFFQCQDLQWLYVHPRQLSTARRSSVTMTGRPEATGPLRRRRWLHEDAPTAAARAARSARPSPRPRACPADGVVQIKGQLLLHLRETRQSGDKDFTTTTFNC